MKSSLAISAEIEQDALLKKIMNVVIESSGAQHGYLLIEDEGNLLVRAESHVTEKGEAVQTLNRRLEDADRHLQGDRPLRAPDRRAGDPRQRLPGRRVQGQSGGPEPCNCAPSSVCR